MNYLKSDDLGSNYLIDSAKNTKEDGIYGSEVELRNSGKLISPENASVKECYKMTPSIVSLART